MNLNKAMLIGRLGRDPEVRYTNSGSAVANFSMATTDTWKDKDGQRQERTEWHNIVAWGQLADFAKNYLKKGMAIYVEGRLQTSDWLDKENVKRYKTEVVANAIKFMEPKGDGGKPPMSVETGPPSAPSPEAMYLDDDIPF